MKYAFQNITALIGRLLPAFALAACLGSCASDGDSGPDAPQPPAAASAYEFGLYVSVGDNALFASSLPSEAAPGFEPGQGYENYIDLAGHDYRIYLFDSNNVLIADIDPLQASMLPVGQSPGTATYELRFEVTGLEEAGINPASCTFKLLMIANWGQYPAGLSPGETTISQIMESAECLRAYSAPAIPGPGALVPMFGVSQCAQMALQPDVMTHAGKLHLLRALAKVEVYDDDDSGAAITAVSLTRHNASLWCAPTLPHYLQTDYLASATAFRPTAHAETAEPLVFARDEATGHFLAYVPEYVNLALGTSPRPEAERARIRIEYADGRVDYLDFKYYDSVNAAANGASTGDYFDIRRNYWYRYCVNKGTVVMAIRADQVPYISVSLNPGFGFDDPLEKPPSEWVTPPWVEIEQ